MNPNNMEPTPALSSQGSAEIVIDARGLLCPQPVIELGKAARGASAGQIFSVLCTDAAARIDIPAWARLTGNKFRGEKNLDGGAFALTVQISG